MAFGEYLDLLWGRLRTTLFAPLRALRWRYVPLLLVYFTYGASSIGGIAFSFWIKEDLNLSIVQLASVGVWAAMPWTIKMIWGQLIDTVPLLGSRRKAYVYLGAFFTAMGLSILASLASHYAWVTPLGSPFTVYLLGMVCMALGFAIQDAAADTMSTEVVSRVTAQGRKRTLAAIKIDLAQVQVLGRLALSLGILSVAKLSGVLAQVAQARTVISYQHIFWGMLLLPLLTVVGTAFIRLESEQHGPRLKLDRGIFSGGLLLGALTLIFGYLRARSVTLIGADEVLFLVSLGVISWMIRRLVITQPERTRRQLYATMAALFLFRMTPGVGAGLSWWLIDVLHFDPAFFGTLSQIGALVPVIVLWLFSDTIAHKPIRKVLLFLIVVGTILSLPDLVLYFGGAQLQSQARAIMYFTTALASPLTHISMIPLLSLIAFYAPEKLRGTWFAVASSLLNLALMGAELGTKYLNMAFVITRGNYTQLGGLLLVVIGISLIVPLWAVVFFLPRTKTKEKMV